LLAVMNTTTTTTNDTPTPHRIESLATLRTEALVGRLLEGGLGSAELLSIELGRRLHLYDVLFESGPVTAADFATAAGIAPHYAREWLEQQSVAGILDVVWPGAVETREYLLPGAHVPVLVDPDSRFNQIGLSGFDETLAEIAEAYRSEGGVGFGRSGTAPRRRIAGANRPGFVARVRSRVDALRRLPRMR